MGWLPSAPQFAANPLTIASRSGQGRAPVKDHVVAGLKSGALRHGLRGPRQSRQLPSQSLHLALEPVRLVRQRTRIFPEALPRHAPWLAGQGPRRNGRSKAARKWSGAIRRRRASSILSSRSTSACRRAASIPTSSCRRRPGTKRTTSTPPTCIPSSTRCRRRWIRCGSRAAIGRPTRRSRTQFSELAEGHLGVERDVVLTPLQHDTPAELAQPFDVKGLEDTANASSCPASPRRRSRSSSATIPTPIAASPRSGRWRTSSATAARASAGTPRTRSSGLGELNRRVNDDGPTEGRPRIETDIDAAEVILYLAPETNGEVAVKAWQALGKKYRPRPHASGRDARGRKDPLSRHPGPAAQDHLRRRPGRASRASMSATAPATPM